MAWKEEMDKLEEKLVELQEKEEALNDASAAQKVAQDEYNLVNAEVTDLRDKLNNTLGGILGGIKQKVKQY